jgi:hypothetical protein
VQLAVDLTSAFELDLVADGQHMDRRLGLLAAGVYKTRGGP